jgi:putative hemolysin
MAVDRLAGCGLLTASLLLLGCAQDHAEAPPGPRDVPEVQLANPAAKKCAAGGYSYVNAPVGESLCREPGSGKQCEVWAWYRGECTLPPRR